MLYCKNAACGVYLGSMGADSCSLCGHVDQDAIESAACADREARVAELERELAEVRKQMGAQKDEWLSWDAKRSALEKDAGEAQASRVQKWPVSQDPLTQLQVASIISERDAAPQADRSGCTAGTDEAMKGGQ